MFTQCPPYATVLWFFLFDNETSTEAMLAPGSCTVEYKELAMRTLYVAQPSEKLEWSPRPNPKLPTQLPQLLYAVSMAKMCLLHRALHTVIPVGLWALLEVSILMGEVGGLSRMISFFLFCAFSIRSGSFSRSDKDADCLEFLVLLSVFKGLRFCFFLLELLRDGSGGFSKLPFLLIWQPYVFSFRTASVCW